jgi:hypothetical protein
MNKKPSIQTKRRQQVVSACANLRQRCNKLDEEEQQKLLEEGLKVIYGSDAEAPARRR